MEPSYEQSQILEYVTPNPRGLLGYVSKLYSNNHADLRMFALDALMDVQNPTSLHINVAVDISQIPDKEGEKPPQSQKLREKIIAFLEKHSDQDSALHSLAGLNALDKLSTVFNAQAVTVLHLFMSDSIYRIAPAMVALMNRQENINNNTLQDTEPSQTDHIKRVLNQCFAVLLKPQILTNIWGDVVSAVRGPCGQPNQNGLIDRAWALKLINDEQASAVRDVFSRHAYLLTQKAILLTQKAMVEQAEVGLGKSAKKAVSLFDSQPLSY